MLIDFVDAFTNFEKPLIAGVNGPAIGIGVTTLALCDLVLASSNSTFQCPFTKIGQSPEGTSSYSMPAILGPSGASELLLRNNIFTVEEMRRLKLVGRIIDETDFREEFEQTLTEYANLPPESLKLSKQLIRSNTLDKLKSINRHEIERLQTRWTTDECIEAIMTFFQRKS